MWNVIAANRLLDKYNRQKHYKKHRKTLSCIKSQIDNLPPQEFSFLTSRPKAKQQAYQKKLEVESNNHDLIRRMVQPKSNHEHSKIRHHKHSLHSAYLKLKADMIDQDNRKFVQRLQGTTACLNFGDMEVKHQQHLRWKKSHKKPSELNLTRPLSAR